MARVSIVFAGLCLAGMAALSAQSAAPAKPRAAAPAPAAAATPAADTVAVKAAIDSYCVSCHSTRVKAGGLVLDTLDPAHPETAAAAWEKVIRKLRAETMPPVGRPRPSREAYRTIARALEQTLDRAAGLHPNPGRPEAFHRLNRAEYQNAIRDLLGLEVDVTGLIPADNTYEHGFDNNADSLSLSPDLLARYASAARVLSRKAVGVAPRGPETETYKIHPNYLQDDRVDEDLPFGSRGGIAIRHYFPVSGEYGFKIKLQRNFSDYIIGFSSDYQVDVRLDGRPLKQFAVGDADKKGQAAPLSFSGNIAGDPDWEYYMNTGDGGLEAHFQAPAGPHVLAVSFLRRRTMQDGVQQPRNRGYGRFVDEQYDGDAGVEHVEIRGPYTNDGPGDTPSRRAIFVCRPKTAAEETPCATSILSKLARRGFRRPAAKADIDTLLTFYRKARTGGSFDLGVQAAVERLLIDPEFLFRVERDPAKATDATYRVSPLTLASRLSFFIWSSIPDEPLLSAAVDGTLGQPAVLERHVRRMLADPRARSLVDNFAAQWLRLRNLKDQQRESADYPEFDENLREAYRRETELFVWSTIREDRSVVDLLGARHTYVNERLARQYGIPNVYGPRFRRVELPPDSPRGGLLGQGSVLTLTSHPNRTSPVLRGKWLLESILGSPPPAPPENVPSLPDRGEGGRPASVRERLEVHRRNPVCASCHTTMDPLGFALEPFDAIGTYRAVSETGAPLDATGTMPSGSKFEGPSGLRNVLLEDRERFALTVTEKLMAFALGRGLEYYDRPAVRRVAQTAAARDYRWSDIVLGIVESVPFQLRATAPGGGMAGATTPLAAREPQRKANVTEKGNVP
jgi:mono/diheme cytochrome c family protein